MKIKGQTKMETRFEKLTDDRIKVHVEYIHKTLTCLHEIVREEKQYTKGDICLNTLIGCIFTIIKDIIGDDEEMQREFVRKITQLFVLNFQELNRQQKEREERVT
jgi:hypothetical protein